MDYDKLIERLRGYCQEWEAYRREQYRHDLEDAATALSTLQAENGKLRAELEAVREERDALTEDFVDYVTGGIHNTAIYCKNRSDRCVDMRGWCTGRDCKGFYPSGASGPEKGD